MGKTVKIFIFIVVIILLFVVGRNYLFDQKFQKIASSVLPKDSSEILQNKTFVSQDGLLNISYPQLWIEVPVPLQEETVKIKTIFVVASFTLAGKTAQLRVAEMAGEDASFETTVEQMQKANKKDGWAMEILLSSENVNEFMFDALYRAPEDKEDLRSKEKILVSSGKIYMVAVIAPETEWSSFEKEAQYILEHTKLTVPSL